MNLLQVRHLYEPLAQRRPSGQLDLVERHNEPRQMILKLPPRLLTGNPAPRPDRFVCLNVASRMRHYAGPRHSACLHSNSSHSPVAGCSFGPDTRSSSSLHRLPRQSLPKLYEMSVNGAFLRFAARTSLLGYSMQENQQAPRTTIRDSISQSILHAIARRLGWIVTSFIGLHSVFRVPSLC